MPLSADEEIARAVCTDKWDGERISPSAFTGPDTSVGRLKIIPLDDHWDLFRHTVAKPPERLLERIAEINVGRLAELGRTHQPPATVTVEADPVDLNRAHAVIPGKRSRGLATRIRDACGIHTPPPGWRR